MLKKRFPLPLLATLLLLFSSCSSPYNSSSGKEPEERVSSTSSYTDYEHSCKPLSYFISTVVEIKKDDYAWYYFKNRTDDQQFFGFEIVNPDPVCIEPYHEQISGFSPETRKEVALTGTIICQEKEQFYTFYDFYLPRNGIIYFRISSRNPQYLLTSVAVYGLEYLKSIAIDDYGNHYLNDLHVHELTFYSCDPDSQDYDPMEGHYHTCWKGDLSVFEEHTFQEPYVGEDGKTYVSCQYCNYTKEISSSGSSNP